MTDAKPYLLIEDIELTMRGLARELEWRRCDVHFAPTFEAAVDRLQERKWLCLIVDLFLPNGAPDPHSAGGALVANLRAGKYGTENQETPFAVVTAYLEQADQDEFQRHEPFIGLFNKAGDSRKLFTALRERGLIDPDPDFDDKEPEHLASVPVRVESFEGGVYRATIWVWGDEAIEIEEGDLTPSIRSAIRSDGFPTYLIALANVAATKPESLRLSDFRYEGPAEPFDLTEGSVRKA